MAKPHPLEPFLPAVRAWFESSLGQPSPPQVAAWPVIRDRKNTLILAPTGSGKTLAAFLACLDELWRTPPTIAGVRVLYISPLKALNNDIHKNLRIPLDGIVEFSQRMGSPLAPLSVALRTGDTPAAERRNFLKKPAQILITTPESLHLLLGSKARESLRGVTHCIVDEIHALCPNKRGVFLSLLLERLHALTPNGFLRIGLSATQRPLEEVARYLGGFEEGPDGQLHPRPVTIVDIGMRKDLDLRIVNPVEQFGAIPEKTVWPAIYGLLRELIDEHDSTIVFANNRRQVERITAQLNEGGERARAHHGSVSLEARLDTEQALKEGRLKAVVSTASLELGIDMGAVDLVCQIESPGSVSRALQRVGRAGHLVGGQSKGRLIPKLPSDLLEQAVLAREMLAGRVEALHVPRNCLDVLAQQVIAAVGMEEWEVPRLYALVRQAFPFRELTPEAFEAVLLMVSGRLPISDSQAVGSLSALRARVSWDRIHNRLLPLPSTRAVALLGGGTIPNTGQFAAYTSDGKRVGELDEEFIYERRVGETFLLGTSAWRIESIDKDRVLVSPSGGAQAIVPFWRGEQAGRTLELGEAVGRFLREIEERLEDDRTNDWLQANACLDDRAAANLISYIGRQKAATGCIPTDRRLLIEASPDQLGDWQVALLSPLGSRFHFGLRLALEGRLSQRLAYCPRILHHNEGLLIRFSDTQSPPLDLFDGLTEDNVEEFVLSQLSESALFTLRFRQNAARALLLPHLRPGKRAPLWLQRLRSRELLQVARRHPDFPLLAETLRECLHDHLDLPRLKRLLRDIHSGEVEVVARKASFPCPFAAGMIFSYTAAFMYQYDGPEPGPSTARPLNQRLLEQLLEPEESAHALDPRAVEQIDRRLRGLARLPRTAAETAEWLRRLGDVDDSNLPDSVATFLKELATAGVACRIHLEGTTRPDRWILSEERELYSQAIEAGLPEARLKILERYLQTRALVGCAEILERYPFPGNWLEEQLYRLTESHVVVAIEEENVATQYALTTNLHQLRRATANLARNETPTRSTAHFVQFLLRWHGVHRDTRRVGPDGLEQSLCQLAGLMLPAKLWDQAFLPARVAEYQPAWLRQRIATGEWSWWGRSGPDRATLKLGFASSAEPRFNDASRGGDAANLSGDARLVLEQLRKHGASFVADLSRWTSLSPSQVRAALWTLIGAGLATNDEFDVALHEPQPPPRVEASVGLTSRLRPGNGSRRSLRERAEGRWSALDQDAVSPEIASIAAARQLLQCYGVVTKELVDLADVGVSWQAVQDVCRRLELTGEVQRGYFVASLSGIQFALHEAARHLQAMSDPASDAAATLIHSQDPANLFGLAAPFSLADEFPSCPAFGRREGNWLVVLGGRPALLVEQQGRRLTLSNRCGDSIAKETLESLVKAATQFASAAFRRVTVDTWNGQPVLGSAAQPILEELGFVRDYRAMTRYARS